MLRTITLASLLLVSTSLLAHSANDPQHAHQAYWRDSSGAPILDSSGNCVRTGSFAALGSPSCYPPKEVVTTPTTVAPAIEPKATPAVEQTEEETVTAIASTEAATVEAENTSEEVLEERQAPASPKAEPVSSPEPIEEVANTDVQVEAQAAPAEPTAITFSYPIETLGTHIYFDFDKNNLKIAEQEKLEELVIAAMQAHKVVKVSVEGHADSRGTDAYNYALSQRRINTVVNYLNLRGIDTNSTMAWGESKLIYFADGSENYDHSRRSEVMVRLMRKVQD